MQRRSKRTKAGVAAMRTANPDPDRLEIQREALLQRLAHLGDKAKNQRGYETARRLLNQKFRKATLAARLGILQAATFMIEVLEMLPFT